MEDFEKNRIEYVQQLETQLAHLRGEYTRYKEIAEMWEPRITVKTNPTEQTTTFGLQFGGKMVHATVTNTYLAQTDSTSANSSIVDALVESLVVEKISKLLLPEVQRTQAGARISEGAGKW